MREGVRIRKRYDGASIAEKAHYPRATSSNGKLVWIIGGSAAAMLAFAFVFSHSQSSSKAVVARSTTAEPITLKITVSGSVTAISLDKSGGEKRASDGTPKPADTDEKSLRAEAQGKAGGLFASLQAGANNQSANAPAAQNQAANPSAKAEVELNDAKAFTAAAQSMGDFEARFKALQPLIDAEKYSDAENLLNGLSKDFSPEPWWTKHADRVTKAQATVRGKNDELEQRARAAVAQAQGSAKKEQLDGFENDWKGKLASGGSAAKAAQQVLDAVRASRDRLAKGDNDGRAKILADTFEKLEKRTQPKLSKADLEYALKALNDLKTQLVSDPALAEKFSDRWAALSFDLNLSRGAEQALFHVEPSGNGPSDVNYDFKNADQVAAWSFEGDGANSGSIDYDDAAKLLVLKAVGEHQLDPRSGKRVPMATLPFYFNPGAAWAFEAEAGVLKVHAHEKKDQLPSFGILVSDGGTNVIRLSVKECRKNELCVSGRGACDEKETTGHLPGKQEDKIRFRMVCSSGRISFTATSSAKPIELGRMPIGFEPKFVGLYIETHDKEENASIAFDNVKISGMMDKAKIGAVINARRSEAVNAVKAELGKTNKPNQPVQFIPPSVPFIPKK